MRDGLCELSARCGTCRHSLHFVYDDDADTVAMRRLGILPCDALQRGIALADPSVSKAAADTERSIEACD